MWKLSITIFLISISRFLIGQDNLTDSAQIVANFMFFDQLKTVEVSAKKDLSYRKTRKYQKTLKRVKKVYPYALLGSEMYDNYLMTSDNLTSKKEKRKFLKTEEELLKDKFESRIRDITIKEGIILVKLIDRETSHTSYEILKELKGGGSAFFWQGIARLFGSSLKHEYDPQTRDWMLEEIVLRIQRGEI